MDKLQREVLLAALDWADPRIGDDASLTRLEDALRAYTGVERDTFKAWRDAIDAMRAKLTENPNA